MGLSRGMHLVINTRWSSLTPLFRKMCVWTISGVSLGVEKVAGHPAELQERICFEIPKVCVGNLQVHVHNLLLIQSTLHFGLRLELAKRHHHPTYGERLQPIC